VPEAFYDSLTVSDVVDGFAGRCLTVQLDLEAVRLKKKIVFEPFPKLLEVIKFFADTPIVYEDDEKTKPLPRIISKTSEASAHFDEWQDKYIALQNKNRKNRDGISSIYARVPEQAHKLALLMAVNRKGGFPKNVELEDVMFGCRLMDYITPPMVDNIRSSVAYNPQDALLRRVTSIVERRGRILKEELYRTLKDCTHKQAEDVVNILVNSGKVNKIQTFLNGKVSYMLEKA
jgi:hypothetical protein